MLPNEIDPFADAHIKMLTEMQSKINAELENPKTPLTNEDLKEFVAQLRHTKHALVRFKVCMADEVKQKERYAKYAKEHGYPYS